MQDPIADFFVRLADRDAGPLLGDLTATVRFDATGGGTGDGTGGGPVYHWRMTLDHGRVEVTDSGADADCVVSVERPVFEDLVTGRHNVMAALLRGQVIATGDPDLLVRVERLFSAHGVGADTSATAETSDMATAGGSR